MKKQLLLQENENLVNEVNRLREENKDLKKEFCKIMDILTVRTKSIITQMPTKVYHNSNKATTVVFFKDGSSIKVKRKKGERDDVYTAVAYAIIKKKYDNLSKFTKLVDSITEEQ